MMTSGTVERTDERFTFRYERILTQPVDYEDGAFHDVSLFVLLRRDRQTGTSVRSAAPR
jgi:hypothetical protein